MADERIETLRKVSLFEGLSDRELEAVARAAKERRFDTGDTVVVEGEGGVGFFVVAREPRGSNPAATSWDDLARGVVRRGRAARRRRPAQRHGHRRVAAAGVRPDGVAVHAAARTAPVDRRQGRQDARPPPARGRGTGGHDHLIQSRATVLGGEIAVPCTGNPL